MLNKLVTMWTICANAKQNTLHSPPPSDANLVVVRHAKHIPPFPRSSPRTHFPKGAVSSSPRQCHLHKILSQNPHQAYPYCPSESQDHPKITRHMYVNPSPPPPIGT
jgi:hypothetical protein